MTIVAGLAKESPCSVLERPMSPRALRHSLPGNRFLPLVVAKSNSEAPVPVDEGVPLADLTTLEVGGPARFLASCRGAIELAELLIWADARRLRPFVLGGGSNLLVADSGLDGLVLRQLDDSIVIEDEGDRVRVRAGAGVVWDELVERTVGEGLGGLECLSGIPGKVGAAPMQNVGAYGQEVSETIDAVRVVARTTGVLGRLPGARCGFGYRTSHFKGEWRDRYLVTGVEFLLPRRAAGAVRYPELQRRLGMTPDGPAPILAEVRSAVLEVRRGKSMVLESGDPNRRSAGSFFLNPHVTPAHADAIRRRFDSELPEFPAAGGKVKIPAARLIEEAGFERGFTLGRAGISSRHSLALINRGSATAADVIALAARIRRGVRDAFGVTLVPEPTFVGFEKDVDTLLEEAE